MINIKEYQRGFVFYSNDYVVKKIPNYFCTKSITNNFSISYDKDYPINIKNCNEVFVVMIGIAIDTQNYELDLGIISENILNYYSKLKSIEVNEPLLDYIDYLGGRYCFIIIDNDESFVFNDACGLRSVYYHETKRILSSHYNLLNDFVNEENNDIYKAFIYYKERCASTKIKQPWVLPGNLSPYNNIKQLVCNHFYDLKNHKLIRFYPRIHSKRILNSVDESIHYIGNCIKSSLTAISKKYKIYQSITRGNDSRMSLSASKDLLESITFFSYSNTLESERQENNFDIKDRDNNVLFGQLLSKKFGINFVNVSCSTDLSNHEKRILVQNHYHQHIPGIISGFRKLNTDIDPYNTVHIRTNITELLRHSYFKIQKSITDDELVKKILNWSMIYDDTSEYYKLSKKYILDYIKEISFKDVSDYEYGDMFYWEYRMNQWQSAVLINQDPIFDTIILFNTRKILEFGMNLPREIKEKNEIVYQIEKLLWSELLELKHPNKILNSEDYVDWYKEQCIGLVSFDTTILNQTSYSLISGNLFCESKNIKYFSKANLSSISFGFSSNLISKGDFVDLLIPLKLKGNKRYYFDITILCFYSMFSNDKDVTYQVFLGNKKIYELGTNIFSRPNQIIYLTTNNEKENKTLCIRLLSHSDSVYKNFNGLIDVQNVIVREENLDKDISDRLYSTYDNVFKHVPKVDYFENIYKPVELNSDVFSIFDEQVQCYKKRKVSLPTIFSSININELENEIPNGFNANVSGIIFPCVFYRNNNSNKLFVILSSTRNFNETPPMFKRWSYNDVINENLLLISDPMLSEFSELLIGWFIGKERINYSELASQIVKKIQSLLKIEENNICIFGSSSGGYVSLYMSKFFSCSTHVAINPQIFISKYKYFSSFKKVTGISLCDGDDRLNFMDYIKVSNCRYLVIQNVNERSDCNNHLFPLLKELFGNKQCSMGINSMTDKFFVWLYNCFGGHNEQGDKIIFHYIMEIINKLGHLNSEDISHVHLINTLWRQLSWFKLVSNKNK